MPKPTTIFSAKIKGVERLVFSIQERTAGDLTIIVKHSLFHPEEEGGKSTEADRVIEERFSIHQSKKSNRVNVIKYTKVLKDGRLLNTNNYTMALKGFNQLAGIFIRRGGDLSGDRYIVQHDKGNICSLGKYDPEHFQPIFYVLVGPPDRKLENPFPGNKNIHQVRFTNFSIVVIWQFFAFTGQTSTKSLILKTFSDEEIAAAPLSEQEGMRRMGYGFSEGEAIEAFDHLKRDLALELIRTTWRRSTEEEKKEYAPLIFALQQIDSCLKRGRSFTHEHRLLLSAVQKEADLYRSLAASGKAPGIGELLDSWPSSSRSTPILR